jgi:hypothetical protein
MYLFYVCDTDGQKGSCFARTYIIWGEAFDFLIKKMFSEKFICFP